MLGPRTRRGCCGNRSLPASAALVAQLEKRGVALDVVLEDLIEAIR